MKRFSTFVLALVVIAGVTQPALAQKRAKNNTTGDILPFKATEKVFPNGLKVIVVPTGFPNIVSSPASPASRTSSSTSCLAARRQ